MSPQNRTIPGTRGVAFKDAANAASEAKQRQRERQRAALADLSQCEIECGLTVAQIDEIHAVQRARVRARYGTTSFGGHGACRDVTTGLGVPDETAAESTSRAAA